MSRKSNHRAGLDCADAIGIARYAEAPTHAKANAFMNALSASFAVTSWLALGRLTCFPCTELVFIFRPNLLRINAEKCRANSP
jgi:hypothetical protein